MKEEFTKREKQLNDLQQFVAHGIPVTDVRKMCKKLGLNYNNLNRFLCGQTGRIVGSTMYIYETDVIRFIRGLHNND